MSRNIWNNLSNVKMGVKRLEGMETNERLWMGNSSHQFITPSNIFRVQSRELFITMQDDLSRYTSPKMYSTFRHRNRSIL